MKRIINQNFFKIAVQLLCLHTSMEDTAEN